MEAEGWGLYGVGHKQKAAGLPSGTYDVTCVCVCVCVRERETGRERKEKEGEIEHF